MTSYYYKVVQSCGNKYISAIVSEYSDKYTLFYEINKTTKPEIGGIFIFKDYNDALSFKLANNFSRKLVILKCKVKNPRKLMIRSELTSYDIDDFWSLYYSLRSKHKSIKHIKDKCEYTNCPNGTYIVSELTPVEVMK